MDRRVVSVLSYEHVASVHYTSAICARAERGRLNAMVWYAEHVFLVKQKAKLCGVATSSLHVPHTHVPVGGSDA